MPSMAAAARALALQRQGCANAALDAGAVEAQARATAAATNFLRQAAERLGWSGRGLHRTLRVARTVADLAGSTTVELPHVAEALQFRRGVIGASAAGMAGG